jgi:hypothetical protein
MPAIRWTSQRRTKFLKELGRSGNISAAARKAGVSRSHAYAMRSTDIDFASEWTDALENAVDSLEAEARRRAVDGVDSPHFHQGNIAGTVKKYSDSLLMFLLKAHRPERYRERAAAAADTPDLDEALADEVSNARETLETRLAGLDTESDAEGA